MLSALSPSASTISSAAAAISSVVNRARISHHPLTSTAYVKQSSQYVHRTYEGGAHADDHPDRTGRFLVPRHAMRGVADAASRAGAASGCRAGARTRSDDMMLPQYEQHFAAAGI